MSNFAERKNAFQGETDFAGRERSAGRGGREKAKSKARGVISSSHLGAYGVFCQNTRNRPCVHGKFLFSTFLTVHIHNRKPFKYLNLLIQFGFVLSMCTSR